VDQGGVERVEPQSLDAPSRAKDPDLESADVRPGRGTGERDQPGRGDLGQVPGEFERISLAPAKYPAFGE